MVKNVQEQQTKQGEGRNRDRDHDRYESYRTNRGKGPINTPMNVDNDSVTTIYKDAVNKRTSSSSEDWNNTSDELSPNNPIPLSRGVISMSAVSDLQNKFQTVTHQYFHPGGQTSHRYQPHHDDEEGELTEDNSPLPQQPTLQQQARDHAEGLIKEAEASKVRIYEVPGKQQTVQLQISLDFQFIHSALVDADYQLVAVHVDAGTRKKI